MSDARSMGPRWRHGGVIGAAARDNGEQAAGVDPEADADVNPLEAALARTANGRRLLTLLAEAARLRIHVALAADLLRSAEEDLVRLRRDLSASDGRKRERAAAQIARAQGEVAKWTRAHADYESRRCQLEFIVAQEARAVLP